MAVTGDLVDGDARLLEADVQPFAWDAPSAEHSVDMEDRSPSVDLAAPQSTPIIEDEPQIDRSDIQWFDWDEDDLL